MSRRDPFAIARELDSELYRLGETFRGQPQHVTAEQIDKCWRMLRDLRRAMTRGTVPNTESLEG